MSLMNAFEAHEQVQSANRMKQFYRQQQEYLGHGACRAESVVRGEHYRFTVLTSRLLRMEYSPDGVFEDRPSQVVLNRSFDVPEFRVQESENRLEISTEAFHLVYNKQEFSAENLYIDAKNRYTNYGARWKYGARTYGNPARHHNLYGTARTLDKIDGELPLDYGLQDSSGRSFFDDSTSLLLTEDGWLAPRQKGSIDTYFLCYGHDYLSAIADFYRLTGAPPMLPRYAFGNWWSRYWKYTEESYLKLMDTFRQNGMPFTVAVMDMDWHKTDIPEQYGRGWTGYSWNRDLFPDPERFLQELHREGFHCALNLHPADGVQGYEDAYPEMAEDMGLDPESGEPVLFDAASAEHWRAYFRRLIHPNEQKGVDFWWIDWQQGTESGMPGLDPLWALNHFHFLDSCREDRRGMILSRYAGLGSHRYPFGFSGDTVATWNSLQFQPYFTATAANVGYGCWSHDIGGFKTGVRERELYIRWMQFGVFSPAMRMHSSNNPFCSKEPWSYGEQIAGLARSLFQLRHRLIPFLYTCSWRTHRDLVPAILPLYYRYPEHCHAYNFPNEYLLGEQLLVCPITSPTSPDSGMASFRAWIPEGLWTDVFSGRTYCGSRVMMLNRDIEHMAVLAKAGAIVPLAENRGGDNSVENPSCLDVYVFPGADGSFDLYEDSGDGYAYRSGESAITSFSYSHGAQSALTVTVSGDLSVLPESRTYRLHFRGFRSGIRAIGDGIASQCYREDDRTLSVELLPVRRGETVRVELENSLPDDNSGYQKRVFDFLMQAQLPVELKTKIYKLYKKPLDRLEIALGLHALRLPASISDVLYELTFSASTGNGEQ